MEDAACVVWNLAHLHPTSAHRWILGACGLASGIVSTRVTPKGQPAELAHYVVETTDLSVLPQRELLLRLKRSGRKHGWMVRPWLPYSKRPRSGPTAPRKQPTWECGDTLGVGHLNVNSLAPKIAECSDWCASNRIQVLGLCETYGPNATPDPDHRFRVPGMQVFQSPYEKGTPGSHGVANCAQKGVSAVEW